MLKMIKAHSEKSFLLKKDLFAKDFFFNKSYINNYFV